MHITRRQFARNVFGAATLASLARVLPPLWIHSALAATRQKNADASQDTVLVVIQLSGGNDGLNTVVPYRDDAYARSRPTLRLAPDEVLKIDDQLGFHPRMTGFMRLFQEQRLSVIQGVGYPKADRDHNGAMRIWHLGDPKNTHTPTGWLGRAADALWHPSSASLPAMFVGGIPQPFAMRAEQVPVPKIQTLNEVILADQLEFSPDRASLPKEVPEANPWLKDLRKTIADTVAASRQIKAARREVIRSNGFPPFPLAADLRVIAELIRTGLGIRIYYAEIGGGGIGGFDNHANQKGNHCAILHQLSESIAAFMDELRRDKLIDRVLLMTVSEFGRTVAENGRRGTDHGAAAPVFVAGGKLKGGFIGSSPRLDVLDNGGLQFHTDFRRIYATVLDRWLALPSREILGQQFDPVDFLTV